jgi:hypothetical protein
MSTIRTVLSLCAALAVSGTLAEAAGGPRKSKDCINTREINVMSPLDDKHVFVKAGASRHYLFAMDAKCPGLALARRIAVWERATRVCGDGFSLLAFEEPAVGSVRCRIQSITAVEDKGAALALIGREGPAK